MIRYAAALAILSHIVHSYVRAIMWSIETGSPSVGTFFTQAVILDVDWDAVFAITLGIGALGMVVLEHRRTTKLDDLAQDMGERIAKIETLLAIDAPHGLAERVASLEAASEQGPDTVALAERVAVLETKREYDERLAEVERKLASRKERNARGQFASTCEDPTR